MPMIKTTTRVVEQVQSRKCKTSSEGDERGQIQSTDSMRDLVCSITELRWRSKQACKAIEFEASISERRSGVSRPKAFYSKSNEQEQEAQRWRDDTSEAE